METNNEWIVTDPSCNQMYQQINGNTFLFKEDRIINPITKETESFESEICLSDYTQDEMFENVQPFGYSFNEMCDWIDNGNNLALIAECIFEMEYQKYFYEPQTFQLESHQTLF